MKCNECGSENPNQAKFCRKCGTSLGVHLRCAQCGTRNPADSVFCSECGERLSGTQKSTKGSQRKCKTCGQFNELDALFCVNCGEEMIRGPRENEKGQTSSPSYKTIVLVIGLIFLLGLFVKAGTTLFKKVGTPRSSSTSAPVSTPMTNVDEEQVIAVAKNFKCACGDCAELPETLDTCSCDKPKGAVETKNFIRAKLSEGLTVEQVIDLLDKTYGHRV